MAKFLYTQYNFSSGELSPRLLGRTDLREYFSAAKEVTNFVVASDGGLNQVRGTYLLGASGPNYDITISDKFVFGINAGVVSFAQINFGLQNVGDDTPSFFISPITVTEVNLPSNFSAFQYGTHITLNDATIITDRSGAVEPLVLRQAAIGGGGTTTERDPVSGEYYNPSVVTKFAWEYRTPIASPPADELRLYTGQPDGLPFYTQSGNPTQVTVGEWTYFRGTLQSSSPTLELYGYYRERDVVTPPSDIGWVLQPLSEWAKDVGGLSRTQDERIVRSRPLRIVNNDATYQMKFTGTQLQTVGFEPFLPTMVGSFVEIYDGSSNYGYYEITNYVDEQTVDATLRAGAGVTLNTNYNTFRLPEWYDGNWPKVIGYFQQRLIFGNTESNPDTAHVSELGNLVSIMQSYEGEAVSDSTPFRLQPSAREVSPIKWILSERYVTMGTGTEEYVIQGVDGIFSDSAARITSVSKYGTAGIGLAFRSQSATYFLERDGKTLREMAYSDENGGYVNRNLGFLGPEISGVTKFVYDYPNKRVYIGQSNKLTACTIDPSIGIIGWSNIPYTYSNLTGIVELNGEPTIISTGVNSVEALFIYKENGSFLQHIENSIEKPPVGARMTTIGLTDGDDQRLANQNIVTSASETVYVFNNTDDEWVEVDVQEASGHGTFTDGDFYITYPTPVQVVSKEPWSKARLETVPVQQGSNIGDSQLAYQSLDRAAVRFFDSWQGVEVGGSDTSMEEITLDSNPFTGVKEVSVDGSPEIDNTIIVENNSALPVVINNILARGTGQEG